MIFGTVGTHEQPFDRLVRTIDELKEKNVIQEEVILQTGFCTYEPRHCRWQRMFSYEDMVKNMKAARIVITHGGPSSFLMSLQMGKIPIVVPRQKQFGEHVNDHQADFVKAVAERQGNIIVVEDLTGLQEALLNYETIVQSMTAEMGSNNAYFNEKLQLLAEELLMEGKNRG